MMTDSQTIDTGVADAPEMTNEKVGEAVVAGVAAALAERDAALAELDAVADQIDSGVIEVSSLALVAQFHETFGVPMLADPGMPPQDRAALRLSLLSEELDELRAAIAAGDIVKIADALTDLQIVLDGTFLEFGLGGLKRALVAEVHASNMSKLDAEGNPVLRADGKILKEGTSYVAPDIEGLLRLWREGGEA